MVNRHQSMSPRNSGFVPLGGGTSHDMSDGIQLTTVKSHASTNTQTGLRKADPTHTSSFENGSQNENEKSGHHHPFHRHQGRRRKPESSLSRQNSGEETEVNAMGRLYNKIIGFSVVTRYLVYVVPIGLLLAVPLIVLPVTGHKDNVFVGSRWDKSADANDKTKWRRIEGPPLFRMFLWIEIMWLSLWIAKVVAWFLPGAFMFFCGVVSMGTRKYATVLSNLIIPFSFFFWALASYITFKNLYKDYNDSISWCRTMERILGALFVSSAVFLGEKALVQLIGISYHQRSFANRIKASKREIHLLGLLYDASRTLFPMYGQDFADEDYIINDSIQMMLGGKKGHKRNGSATPMRLIGDVGRIGDKVTSVFGNIASEITGKQVFNPNSAHSIVLEALEKTKSSEALARRIWMSFVVEDNNALYLEDVQEVLGPAYKKEADEAFDAMDNDMNGDISLDEMVRKVVEISQERKAIGEGMKDIGQALRVFDKILLFVVLFIVIFIFLAFFNSSFVTTLATAGTALLSLSFIFAVTTQEFLGSCIFLFVKHPYDVGDRVEIDHTQMIVDKISLLYTVLTRIDRMQIVQIPNIQLNNVWIENISRSKAMLETVEVNVSFDTSFEDIELLRAELENFVRSPENSRDFQPTLTIDVGGVGNLDKLLLYVAIKHKSNWHNDSVRASRRSKFMCALAMALKKIPIFAPGGGGEALGGPTNPTYSVAVTDEIAAKARDDAKKKKNDDRMVPVEEKDDQAAEDSEVQAISDFSNRPAVPHIGGQWDTRDDHTLASRDHSEDRRRSHDIESLRSGLLKRESTRGRRRAGETLPALTLSETGPRISMTRASPRSPQLGPFDEEAETGMGATPYHSNLAATSSSAGPSGYQAYAAHSTSSAHFQSNVPHPLQSSPSQRGRRPGPPPQGPPPQGPPPPAGQH
ncbi:Fc.00g017590.m01.CDS01 [Cosmosporella sp. VM-42]